MEGRFKSGRFRKSKVKLPGGRTTIRFSEQKPKGARCAQTGKRLHGVPRVRPVHARRMAKSAKRPERPFGGELSSEAMRKRIKDQYLSG